MHEMHFTEDSGLSKEVVLQWRGLKKGTTLYEYCKRMERNALHELGR